MLPKKISRGDVDKGILFDDFCALCAFTRARRAEEYNVNHVNVVVCRF